MKSKRLLGFLFVSFVASLIYGYLQTPRQERVATKDSKTIQRPKTKPEKISAIGSEVYPRLRSDLLERKFQPFPGVRRDIFSSVFVVRQQAEETEIVVEEPPEVIVPPVVDVPPPPPSPQEIAQKEVARYKFLGFMKKGEKKTIFLSKDGEILLVRKGEFLGRDRKYYVVNITDTSLELHKEGAGDFSIKLADQESLTAVPLRPVPSSSPVRPRQEQESFLPDQPESFPVPIEEPPTEDQLQSDEDNQ